MRIYVASKCKHAEKWLALRKEFSIISTWIDEPGVGEDYVSFADRDVREETYWGQLWCRMISEAATCDLIIVYREEGETLKGALVELGAALANNATCYAVGIKDLSVAQHPRVQNFATLDGLILQLRCL